MKSIFSDGINIDVEGKIREGTKAVNQYIALMRDLTDRLYTEVSGSRVDSVHISIIKNYYNKWALTSHGVPHVKIIDATIMQV